MNIKRKKSVYSLQELIRIVLYALIYWSILALGGTREIPAALLALFTGLVTYSLLPNSLLRRLPDLLWTLFTIGAFIFAVLYISYDFLLALLFLFMYLIINKISNPIQSRDAIQVISLCFFLCVCAMTISESLFLSPIIIGYFILFTLSMMLVTFHWDMEETHKAELLEAPDKNREAWQTARIKRLIQYNIRFLLFILPCSLLLFLFIPRFSSYHIFTNIRDIRNSPSTTGFSENVALGSMIGMKKDRTIAMRIQPMKNDGQPLRLSSIYVRGGSLDLYDGRQWIKSFESKRFTDITQTNFITFNRVSHKGKIRVPQRIHLESAVSPYTMGINQPYAMQFAKAYQFAIDYESESIRLLNPDMSNISYITYSFVSLDDSAGSEAMKDTTDSFDISRTKYSRLYLQKPGEDWDARIIKLSSQISGEAVTNYEKAARIREYLMKNYAYSLDFKEKGAEDPIVEFLFDRKTGHCEFFATAMVVLCRAAKIPARIVNGYYSTEWNNYGNYFIVRQQDAHSWVETWFPSTEWVSFDPTPSAGLTRLDSNPLIPSYVQDFLDSLKFKWQKYVIDYNLSDQIRLGSRFRKFSGGLSGSLEKLTYKIRNLRNRRTGTSSSRFLKLVITGLGGALILGSLVIAILKLLHISRTKTAGKLMKRAYARNIVIREYEAILLKLGKMGFTRHPWETPREFADGLISRAPALSQFLPLTLRYYALRYHHETWLPEDSERFQAFLARLQENNEK
ncbi:DUF3488 domain-containing protein [Candidatus Sumerlaeota bacterium]|nr:DUF3488 domain-containing protein [Candidatus Sumerlaeota bacterium]